MGSDITVLGKRQLDLLHIPGSSLQPPSSTTMLTADGSEMAPPAGSLQATLHVGTWSCTAKKKVHEAVQIPVLSDAHCQELAILSPDFPKPILEDLNMAPLKPMVGQPIRIHLKDDAITFTIHTPRPTPFAIQNLVNEKLHSIVQQGIIKPVGDNPSKGCHSLVITP
ncbi:hypothetical protein SK128_010578 [Halocaridina rubra]|uniref:Uncharacterized protein n=1 Tax=Halocaridina rubra TaxID=373956 RepID=A0AAN8XN05_HALRR